MLCFEMPFVRKGVPMEEIVRKIPAWLVAVALAIFVGMLGHSMFVSGKPFQIFDKKFGAIDEMGLPQPVGEIPKNAVVAFDTPDACPPGWSPFAEANSRIIVGAYKGGDAGRFAFDPAEQPLTQYKYRDHNGWEEVTLTQDQMPRHRHQIELKMAVDPDNNYEWGVVNTRQIPQARHGDRVFTRSGTLPHQIVSTEAGSSQPHSNMPPYIALYFCKKD